MPLTWSPPRLFPRVLSHSRWREWASWNVYLPLTVPSRGFLCLWLLTALQLLFLHPYQISFIFCLCCRIVPCVLCPSLHQPCSPGPCVLRWPELRLSGFHTSQSCLSTPSHVRTGATSILLPFALPPSDWAPRTEQALQNCVLKDEWGHLILWAEGSLTSVEFRVSLALWGLTVQAVRFKDRMLPANY